MTDEDEPRLADIRETDQVYQPAEDSHLLAKTAAKEVGKDNRVLDVGTGSGYVAQFVQEQSDAAVFGVDLNPLACAEARERGVQALRADLVSSFCRDSFDVITFNPPYLPSAPEGVWDDWMETAVTGGEDGRAVIKDFLDDVGRVLRPDGAIYLLVSTVTGPEAVTEAAESAGFEVTTLAEESHSFEKLLIFQLIPTGE
ncbi:HemK2/MTQ2 family protein methyltransferase [Halovenus rubra]|uniref:HemK2/MTQ2 family protein methyltransferase n=2 Tax=Halovenus rubra TaxID=869890 RepID=A0ACC7E1F6_9EURY|nr:HemK2/MTQ2 family protein methyltransferase [Halovenus rubra]